jgi:hypothetical protein
MNVKEKILEVLDCALDDLSEERLLEILLDAYKAKKQRISDLENQHAGIQLAQQRDHESVMEERRRMRNDPTYAMAGEYFFIQHRGVQYNKFIVRIAANFVELLERNPTYDMMISQVPREEFMK